MSIGKVAVVGSVTGLVVLAFLASISCACSTKEMAYRASTRSDLRNLAAAQEQFRDSAGSFTADTVLLQHSGSFGVRLELTATDSGWSAVGRHQLVADGRCGIYGGRASNPVRDTVPDVPVCEGFQRSGSRLGRILRRMF